ncbi:hypothetical protein DNTS_015273 [Danionella cerebrum]|uniref:Myb/SANT-like DNA-binding domain-containing protein n=1 Tax=Danionella cerebrum TaxID=2873325 RepID=A0A553MSL5_9TELE|nr:hypothetical protein DNTS_015273 [Danionella translucida]
MPKTLKQWSHKETEMLIKWRMAHGCVFSGTRNTCRNGWEMFIQETENELNANITPLKAKRKWENLKCKYKVLKALARDVETVKPESWRWFRLMESAVENIGLDEVDPPKPTFLTNLLDEPEYSCQPNMKMYQVEMGSDILELLTNSVIEVNTQTVVEANPLEEMKESSSSEFQDDLNSERGRLGRERQKLEKEQAELDREQLLLVREKAVAEREKSALRRDRAQLEKDRAAVDRERAALEQDQARLQRDRAALERDREMITAMARGKNTARHSETNSDRKRLIVLFEKLIDRF